MAQNHTDSPEKKNVYTLQNHVDSREPQTAFAPYYVVQNVYELASYYAAAHDKSAYEYKENLDSDLTTHASDSDEKSSKSKTGCRGCLSKVSAGIAWALEAAFFRIGLFVGRNPVVTVVAIVFMCALCGIGMKSFNSDGEEDTFWVPQSSRLINEKAWTKRTFPEEYRYVTYLLVDAGGNVLTPAVINKLMDIYNASQVVDANGKVLKDLCIKGGPFCVVTSLLELWMYDRQVIQSLTTQDIIDKINKTTMTTLSGVDVKTMLGGNLIYNESGVMVSAEATQMTWFLRKDEDNLDAASYEKKMINMALASKETLFKIYVYASRSFDDEGFGAINHDINLLTAGFSIVFVFIIISLGRFSLLEQKIYLAMSGMACVGLSILVAYGLATAMGVIYSPILSIMPFLLLGIGVDDMFVVVEAWKSLNPEEVKLPTPEKLGLTLSKAGMSITVTSVTDIVAFGIGATTIIPALGSFCIFASLGILALFVLVSTLFAGVLALDDLRMKANRDACICCYRHPDTYTPNRCATGKSFLQWFLGRIYGPFIMKLPVKIFILVSSVTLAGLCLWQFVQMEQDFDLVNYIPTDSYAYSFSRTREDYFQRQGIETEIYCGDFDYYDERLHLKKMHDEMAASPHVQSGTVISWFDGFTDYLQGQGLTLNTTTRGQYNYLLFQFIHSPVGQRYVPYVTFNSSSEPAHVVRSRIPLKHTRHENSAGRIVAMDGLRYIIDTSGIPKFTGDDMPEYVCSAYTVPYMSLETSKVLKEELYRNLALATVAVFIVTLVFIANLWTSIMVLFCVFFTVVDIGGALQLWGRTIDTTSSILLTVAVGLAVDYSAHIGHTFMTIRGERNYRVVMTLQTIGPAVFSGGLSTMLAFILLVQSSSYGFQMFFMVFLTVVMFGLYHGLALLPVILSILGPQPYEHNDTEVPASIAMDVHKPMAENNEYHEPEVSPETPLPNGKVNEPVKRSHNGPVHSLYNHPDDTEHRSSSQQQNPQPTVAEDVSKRCQNGVSSHEWVIQTNNQNEEVTKL